VFVCSCCVFTVFSLSALGSPMLSSFLLLFISYSKKERYSRSLFQFSLRLPQAWRCLSSSSIIFALDSFSLHFRFGFASFSLHFRFIFASFSLRFRFGFTLCALGSGRRDRGGCGCGGEGVRCKRHAVDGVFSRQSQSRRLWEIALELVVVDRHVPRVREHSLWHR
jgi:hypothetical protein